MALYSVYSKILGISMCNMLWSLSHSYFPRKFGSFEEISPQ